MAKEQEMVVMMELSKNDIRALHRAVRLRSGLLKKEANRLRKLHRNREADAPEATVSDLNERLATQFAAELDSPDLGKKQPNE